MTSLVIGATGGTVEPVLVDAAAAGFEEAGIGMMRRAAGIRSDEPPRQLIDAVAEPRTGL